MKLQALIKVYRLSILLVLSIIYIILSLLFHWKIYYFVFFIILCVALYFGKLICVIINGVVIRDINLFSIDNEYQDFIAEGYLTPTRPFRLNGRVMNNIEIDALTLKVCLNSQTTRIMIKDLIYENKPVKISYEYFGNSGNLLEVELFSIEI